MEHVFIGVISDHPDPTVPTERLSGCVYKSSPLHALASIFVQLSSSFLQHITHGFVST